MKHCPTCGTQYTDVSLKFCLQDGAMLGDRSSTDTPTVAFPEKATIEARRDDSQVTQWRSERTAETAAAGAERRSGVVIPVIATAAVMLFVFGVVTIGLWLYLTRGQVESPRNNSASTSNINGALPNNQGLYVPTPSATTTSPTRQTSPTPSPPSFPTPPSTGDRDQMRREVSQSIIRWKSLAEAGDLNAYMDNYADTVDYYRRSGASRPAVRADKARAFRLYDSIRFNISNMNISIDEDGTTATATFDKEWDFRGSRNSSGKVQQLLKFRNENGRWLITGERDLRVY